jgi:N-formylglutamate amidohydrolase
MKFFSLSEGSSPLIISIPHAGTYIPDDLKKRMTAEALAVPDTDWHIPRLYNFVEKLGATVISANYSRYVIDINRPPDNAAMYPGQTKVSLCPDETFEGQRIYKAGEDPDDKEIGRRLETYWAPYHDELKRLIGNTKKRYGYAILYDAHSIKGVLPRLFEGRLPDMNLGTAKGASCAAGMEQAALQAAQKSRYSSILNGRFIGGYITRYYGDPASNVHAMQMELVRENYMDESDFSFQESRARGLREALEPVIQSILAWGDSVYTPARTTA